MDIKHRKTVLDDDASLYNKTHDVVTKEDLKNLSFKEKLHYFKDYYSKAVLVVLIILVGLGFFINDAFINRSECILAVACVNEYQIEKSAELIAKLEEISEVESKKQNANITYYDLEQPNMNMAYITHSATGSVDLLICSQEYFEKSANNGMLADLSQLLPADLYEQLSDKMLFSEVADEDYDTGEITYGDSLPYGIDISDSALYEEYGGYGENPILCVLINSPNTDYVLKAIPHFTGLA